MLGFLCFMFPTGDLLAGLVGRDVCYDSNQQLACVHVCLQGEVRLCVSVPNWRLVCLQFCKEECVFITCSLYQGYLSTIR